MDFMKKSFDRVKQTVEEKLGDASVTEYDPKLQALLNKAEDMRHFNVFLLADVQVICQPDPTLRLLPSFTHEGANKLEVLAQHMSEMSTKVSEWGSSASALGPALEQGDRAFLQAGKAEREYLQLVRDKFVLPLQRSLNEECKEIEAERRTLNTRRLDMDSLKNKIAKSGTTVKAEEDLIKATAAFNGQVEKVRSLITAHESSAGSMHSLLKQWLKLHCEMLLAQHTHLDAFLKKL